MGLIADSVETLRTGDSRQYMTGFKNYLINGNFDIWQRGTSQSISGYGSDDRWDNYNFGSTKTHSLVACTDTERELFNASYFSRTVVSSVAGSSNLVRKAQFIEDVTKLAGKTVTVSFWAKADATKNIAVQIGQMFGTGGTPSTSVNVIGAQLVSLTSTWQKKTITISIPSIVGKTLGTDGVNTSYTALYFGFDVGSSFTNYAGLGQQSGTFDIAQVQLEEGTIATPFEQRPYGLELSLCQRYYETQQISTYMNVLARTSYSAAGEGTWYFKVVKRVTPTLAVGTWTNATGTSETPTPYGVRFLGTGSTTSAANISGCTASAEL